MLTMMVMVKEDGDSNYLHKPEQDVPYCVFWLDEYPQFPLSQPHFLFVSNFTPRGRNGRNEHESEQSEEKNLVHDVEELETNRKCGCETEVSGTKRIEE